MNFLNEIFFNNTIKSYLIVAGIIFIVLMLKKYLSHYIASVFYKLVQKNWKTISKEKFISLVVDPFKWFLFILVSIFSIDKLNFPEEIHCTIYGHSTEDITARLANAFIIISFTWLMLRLVDFVAVVLEEKANLNADVKDDQLIVFFRDFLKVIIVVCGILLIIKACFNQPIGQLLTGLSIVGAALALAAKESLENLIASFIIFFDKPFFTEDTVKVNNITGKVERIGLRSTRIRTPEQTLVTVPNKQMVDSIVDNWSMRTMRHAEINLELSAKTSLEQIENLMIAIKKMLEEKKDRIISYDVFLKDINKAILVGINYFTSHNTLKEFNEIKEDVNLKILQLLESGNIEFAEKNN